MKHRIDTLEHVVEVLGRQADETSSDFDLNPLVTTSWPDFTNLKPAAVLVPLIERANGVNVILTKRSSHLKHHPGQIAFPGGKVDEGDLGAEDTALREATEEIGLGRELVHVLGKMPFHQTVTAFQITPIVGHVTRHFDPVPEAGEVDEVFEVPLAFLADLNNFVVESRYWAGQRRYYYTIPYGPYYIWGATARILRGFADGLNK